MKDAVPDAGKDDAVPDAPFDALPANLVDPPWLRKQAAPKATAGDRTGDTVVPGLEPPGDRRIVWEPSLKDTMFVPIPRSKRCRLAQSSSRPASMRAAKADMPAN